MPPEPLVLGFDTSAAHCAAALLCGETVLSQRTEEMAKGQAERLMPLLEQVLAEGGAAWDDLAAIGVGTGPGNFTGIRIAVSAARGLALALNAPAIGVSAFEALAECLPRPVLATVDARRGLSYAQVVGQDTAPQQLSPDTLPAELIDSGLDCTGHNAPAFAAVTAGRALPPALPVAVAIARIAARRGAAPAPRPTPFYIRGADAAPASDPPPVILP